MTGDNLEMEMGLNLLLRLFLIIMSHAVFPLSASAGNMIENSRCFFRKRNIQKL